jgi:hypothetical protein
MAMSLTANILYEITVSPACVCRYNAPKAGYVGPVTNCTVDNSVMPGAANGIDYHWNNTQRAYRSAHAPAWFCCPCPARMCAPIRACMKERHQLTPQQWSGCGVLRDVQACMLLLMLC